MSVFSERRAGETFELAVPPAPESVAIARLFVAAVSRHFGVGEESVDDLKVAVSEAVTNSIKAHRESGKDVVPVRVRILCDETSCRYEVFDEGGGFDPAGRMASDAMTPPGGLYEGSLGLLLIRALFPDAEIDSNDAGTSVRFAVGRAL